MSQEAESPETLQLIRLVKAALEDGYRHENAAPPPNSLATAFAVSGIIKAQEDAPHNAILCAYFYARCQAVRDPGHAPSAQPPEPGALPAAAKAWLADRQERQPTSETPPPDYFNPEFLRDLVLYTLDAGWQAVQPNARIAETAANHAADILLERRRKDPHWAIILGYFGTRSNALAANLNRRPLEEPDRWFNQAVFDWIQDLES